MHTYTERPGPPRQNEAIQVTADNMAEVAKITGGRVMDDHVAAIPGSMFGRIDIDAFLTQWVIRRPDGYFFVRSDEWFRQNYEV